MIISGIVTTGELEEICKAINAEYGYDCPVCIQFRENEKLIKADYARCVCNMDNGTLCFLNEPLCSIYETFDKEESK